ncbi:TadE/TadG family type IV pilus assembly protein [Afifella pfennigii]|uniref:TadE/TadG family type IV pilus assembly protein n=1 Tax=Afifella pfennigii TaxID=209897 RepID=UPI00068B5CFD|nr:TadE/TadG family type IV pilus assembly protein [Afifella pfennigii]
MGTNATTILHRLAGRWRSLRRQESGIAAVEFALVTPMLLLLGLGGFQMSHFLLAQQKVEKMAFTVADVVSRNEMITAGIANQIFRATGELMRPMSFDDNGLVVLSAVGRDEGEANATVDWQCEGGGTLAEDSQIGQVNEVASLPGGLSLDEGDMVIVAEVFYRYDPVISGFFMGNRDLYKYALFRPRLGQLTSAAGC